MRRDGRSTWKPGLSLTPQPSGGVDDTAKLGDDAIANGLHNAAVMGGDCRLEDGFPVPFHSGQRTARIQKVRADIGLEIELIIGTAEGSERERLQIKAVQMATQRQSHRRLERPLDRATLRTHQTKLDIIDLSSMNGGAHGRARR